MCICEFACFVVSFCNGNELIAVLWQCIHASSCRLSALSSPFACLQPLPVRSPPPFSPLSFFQLHPPPILPSYSHSLDRVSHTSKREERKKGKMRACVLLSIVMRTCLLLRQLFHNSILFPVPIPRSYFPYSSAASPVCLPIGTRI